MKLKTKRFFTATFLVVSALFFMTIAGCKNLALRDMLRVKNLDTRQTDTSLQALLITMYYLDGWRTLTSVGTKDANLRGEFEVTITEKEYVVGARVTAVPKVQGDESPDIIYMPDGGYQALTYESLQAAGGSMVTSVTITALDHTTTKSYDVIFKAGTVDDPWEVTP